MAGQRIELPPYSMFAATPPYSVDGVIVFGLMVDVVVPDPSDELWPVPPTANGRLDLLSETFYGTAELWHVLACVNNWPDALVGFPPGMIIRVPTKARLAAEGILNV